MKRLKFTTLWLLTLWVILSPVYAFEWIVYEATVDGVGTITICNPDDDTQCLTMMDRNLWASVAGIGEASDGYHFQRWNNHGFPSVGDVTSTTDKATWDDSYNNSGYYSEVFIKSSSSPYDYWSDGVSHDNLWWWSWDSAANWYWYTWWVVLNVTGRQWPCPDGYHVPSFWEYDKALSWWVSWYQLQWHTLTMISSITLSSSISKSLSRDRTAIRIFQDDFKIPFAGYRKGGNISLSNKGSQTYLWSSSPSGSRSMYLRLYLSSDVESVSYYRAYAYSVRCFKDSALSPYLYSAQAKFESNGATSVGKVLKVDDVVIAPSITRYGYEIIGWSTDSGANMAQYLVWDSIPDSDTVYYAITRKFPVCEETLDETVDTLTICNPSNTWECLTLMDKNLGASVAWIWSDSDGCMYQWWNNYCFPSVWTVTSTGTLATRDGRFNNNGYYGEIFIKWTSTSKYDYWSDKTPSNHDGLWWWATNETAYPVTNPTERRWPCPEWYHVPSYGEWDKTLTRWTASNNDSSDARIKRRHFESNFYVPFAGGRVDTDSSLGNKNTLAFLWSSSPNNTYARSLRLYPAGIFIDSNRTRASTSSVRCFKDQYIDSFSVTFLPNWATSVGGATPVLNCTDQLSECNPWLLTWCTTTVVMPDITRDGREILGRSTDSGATVAQYHTWETVTLSGDTTFYAITSKVYTATFNANWVDSIWADSASCTVYSTQTSCGAAHSDITICNPDNPWECLTMQDRNLWASVAGTGFCSYGNFYQWWNNYGFSNTGSVMTAGGKVDCTPYGDWNNYSGSTFILSSDNWCSTQVDNLWWWANDVSNNGYWYTWWVVLNLTWRQWPCPDGYHVPSIWEWWSVLSRWASGYALSWNNITIKWTTPLTYFENNWNASTAFIDYFMVPLAGYRHRNYATLTNLGTLASLWSSSYYNSYRYARSFYINSSKVMASPTNNRASAYSIRCFKDISLTQPNKWQASVPAPSITRAGWTVLWWDYSPDSTTATYQPCDEIELTGDTTLYAITKPLTATFLPWETVNTRLKSLATWATVTDFGKPDTLIQQIVRTGSVPTWVTTWLLSTNDSETPIIAWYDNGILYYYSEADILYLNQNSSYMFYRIKSWTYIDTSGWDTSKVTNMWSMFCNCSSLEELDVSGWNTINVTNMGSMFFLCSKLMELDVSGWDTSNVTNMSSMFSSCSSLTELDVSNWNTSKVVSMASMFYHCSSLTGLDVSNFDTSSVTNMQYMFTNCSSLTELDVSNWDTSKVTNMSSMFMSCNLSSLDISNWDTSSVTNMYAMFGNCGSLTELDVSNWDTSKVTNMEYMFGWCGRLTGLNVNNWNISSVTNMNRLFIGCSRLTELDLSKWNTNNVTNMSNMFSKCTNLDTIYVSTWFVTSWVTNSTDMFTGSFKLIWWHGTKWNSSIIDKTYAIIDSELESWYFTYDIAVSYRTRSGVELARQVINVWDTTVAPSITWYNVMGYYTNTWLTTPFDFSQELRTYTEVYVDRVCADGYRLADWVCEKLLTATFLPWQTVNLRLKSLATWATVTDRFSTDTLIQQIVRTGSIPAWVTTWLLSANDSETPIIAWFDNGILYYYSDADILYLDQNSSNMFYNIKSGTYIDTSGWDTSKVTNMWSMFVNCSSLAWLDVDEWNTSSVTYMSYMFDGCSSLTELDVGWWDTSKVIDMSYMFDGCSSLTGLDVRRWDTSSVTNMSYMFNKCSNFKWFDVDEWDTSKVINMSYMFANCSGLIELDVSKWDTSKVMNMSYMFYNCGSLTWLAVSGWNTSKVTSMQSLFANCRSLTWLDVSDWDTSSVTNMRNMFQGCSNLIELDVGKWDTSSVTNMQNMFNNCSSLTGLDVSDWNTSKVTNMYAMFAYCRDLAELDVSSWDISNVTNMNSMFYNCNSLTELNVRGWDTSNVTNMQNMFAGCSSLTWLDVSDWNTSKVTNMFGMFSSCSNLTELDVWWWDTNKVTTMQSMFAACSSLIELDVSDWDTSKVINMNWMFGWCSKLDTIYASTWFITSGVTDSANMFYNTPKLIWWHGTKSPSLWATKSGAVLDSESQSWYLTYDIAVSYRTRSGVELARQVINVWDTTVAPMIIRTWYAVSWWYLDTGYTTLFDFNQPLRTYTELYAEWKCDTWYMLSWDGVTCIPLTYTVRHFIKNAWELSYTLSGTEIFTWIAGEQVYFDDLSQTYPSCIVYSRGSLTWDENGPWEIETKTDIAWDGSTVINLFYDRNTYTVDLSRDFWIDMVEWAGTYECGQEVNIRAYPIDGYHFDMWEGEVD